MQWRYEHHPLKKLFAGLVESAFCVDVGFCNPRLNDYIVRLLIEFIHIDSACRMGDDGGARLETIASMLAWIQKNEQNVDKPERRDAYLHVGDYTLFWTGVFPEGLRRRREGVNPNMLAVYVDRGKESYAIASELTDEDGQPPRSVLRCLSEEFETCAHGLRLVREGWEELERDGGGAGSNLLY
jgi:hypothetical protein